MAFSVTIPALPVQDVPAAVAFYVERLGFTDAHSDHGFAKLVRDDAEIHLWQSGDASWRTRPDLVDRPVRSGAESFLAGTASCRIQVEGVDDVYAEFSAQGVLHPTEAGHAVDTDFGTREFATLDLAGNLLTFFERR